MSEETIEYTNGEVTIQWKASLCAHSGNCVRGLPNVFQPREKPWIKPHQESTEAIVAQVQMCPSGALTFRMNEPGTAL